MAPYSLLPQSDQPIYSLSWAKCIVARCIESHARAWELLHDMYGFQRHWLVKWLACKQVFYHETRRIMQSIDKWTARGLFPGTTTQTLSQFMAVVRKNVSPQVGGLLTDDKMRQIIKEQGIRGEGGGVSRSPPSFTSPPEGACVTVFEN